jgi:two-component system invasion response regulator UvrY
VKGENIMAEENIKVLIVDDHALIRKGITSLLEDIQDIKVIAEASSGEEAVHMIQQYQPDVILMDLQMPGIGGLEAARKILHSNPNIKILALTIYESDVYPLRFLEGGAAGYITKNSTMEELESAIRTVFSGQRYISPTIAQKLALKHFSDREKSPFDRLSKRELQIAMMIMQGQKVKNVAQTLHLSSKTINTYRYRIFEKLGIENDVELTLLAKNYGLI